MSLTLRNIVNMVVGAAGARYFGRRKPLNLMLAVTDRCTGRCAICRIPERQNPDMPLEQIHRLLDEAASLGCQRLGIWGGEPLLRDDLGEIIDHAKRLGLFVTVDTNAHLLPEHDEPLRKVDHLNISLDGDRPAHDSQRGTGSFDRAMKGIEHAAGRYPFWTITVLTKNNLDQIDWILDRARKLGFLTTFQVLHHNDQLGSDAGFHPDDDDLRAALDLLLVRKKQGAPIASSTGYLRLIQQWPDFRVTRRSRSSRHPACMAGRLYVNVDVNGRLYPCSLFVDEIEAPNVLRQGFRQAFAALPNVDCQACLASCYTEYNLLYNLDWSTGWNWIKALNR